VAIHPLTNFLFAPVRFGVDQLSSSHLFGPYELTPPALGLYGEVEKRKEPFRIKLNPIMTGDGHLYGIGELLPEPSTSLDVGENKRDRSTRRSCHCKSPGFSAHVKDEAVKSSVCQILSQWRLCEPLTHGL